MKTIALPDHEIPISPDSLQELFVSGPSKSGSRSICYFCY